jgi:hypothetical protein
MDLDRIKEDLTAFVRWVMRDVTYHRLYACSVQGQDGAGLLDLLPDDAAVMGTGLSKVRIRHGLPGFTVKVPTGARVLLGFDNGDPQKPYAALWEQGSVTSITFDKGTKAVARVDDTAVCGTLLLGTVTTGGPATQATAHQYFPPGTSEALITAAIAAMATQVPVRVNLSSVITGGNVKVLA